MSRLRFNQILTILQEGGHIRFRPQSELIYSMNDKGLQCNKNGRIFCADNVRFNALFRGPDISYKNVIGVDYLTLLRSVHIEGNILLCTTTNGVVTEANGAAVMGKGNAKQIDNEFHVSKLLGSYIQKFGNRAFYLGNHVIGTNTIQIASFPTKYDWRDDSDLTLISKSVEQVKAIAEKFGSDTIFLPYPGISNGRLPFNIVQNVLDVSLDERFYTFIRGNNNEHEQCY